MLSKSKEKNKAPDAAQENTPDAAHDSAQEQPSAAPAPEDAAKPSEPAPAAAEAEKNAPEAKELAAQKDRYMRLMADFDNFRKRQIREREEWLKRANEELLGDLLPIVDHLELALKKTAAPADPFAAGVKLVYDQFISLLDRYGVTPIDAKGQPFDPSIHEALSQMTSPTVPAHVVLDQFRRGWRLAGRLLRPAQVVVSAGAPNPEQASAETDSVSD